MASTILRFRNPNVYQIIDQRAFRFVYGREIDLSNSDSQESKNGAIKVYITYLKDLREISNTTGWEFSQLDRILYIKDKQLNPNLTINH